MCGDVWAVGRCAACGERLVRKLPHRATRQERGFYRAIWVSLPFVLAILNLNSEPDYTHTMNHES